MKVLYFAWLRERIGKPFDEVETSAKTPRDLIAELVAGEERYALAFADTASLRVAVDQKMAEWDTPLTGAKEVAFFPPMTGG